MPDDSFVLKYFQFLNKYLSVGPPFYIVINNTRVKEGPDVGFDFSQYELQNKICGGEGCNQDSLQAQVIPKTPSSAALPVYTWKTRAFYRSLSKSIQAVQTDSWFISSNLSN